jgi:hypothetical protein
MKNFTLVGGAHDFQLSLQELETNTPLKRAL